MLILLRAAADMVFLRPPLGLAGAAPDTPVRALMGASRRSRSALRGVVGRFARLA